MLARAYVLVLSSVFTVHFGLVFFSAMPLNPISLQLRPEITWYVDALFTQNWSLFAPSPPDTDLSILAQYRLSADGHTTDTGWFDITKSLRANVSHNPFTPLAIYTQVLNRTSESLSNAHAKRDPDQDFDFDAPSAAEVAGRIAAAYERTLDLHGELRAVRISLVVHKYPRFTAYAQADDPARDTVHFDYPWNADVAVPGFAQLAR